MRDTWGPPDTGWPSFDAEGKRVSEDIDCMCALENGWMDCPRHDVDA